MPRRKGYEKLYKQIFEEIFQKIQTGAYPPQSKLQSENELSEQYSTSRQTVRLAINQLISRGLVKRIPGKGSFVLQHDQGSLRLARISVIGNGHAEDVDGQVLSEAKIIQGIRKAFDDHLVMTIQNYPHDESKFKKMIGQFAAGDHDGVILISPPAKLQPMLDRLPVPLVVFGHVLPSLNLPHISLNLFKMGYEATRQIVARGHRRFGLIADIKNIGIKRLIAGIENAMVDLHLPWDPSLRAAPADSAQCLEAIDFFISKGVTCILLDEVDYASTVRFHLMSHGQDVPEKVSLLLLEMHKNMAERPPFYSGFTTDHIEHGYRGARILKHFLEGDAIAPEQTQAIIDLEFVEGKTLKNLTPVGFEQDQAV